MTTPPHNPALNPLGSEFDRFLYAQVGDDRHGGLLSVISALARVGVDPWEQAGTLARLPVDGAVRALSALLAKLPTGAGEPLDPIPLATHLVTLLPHRPAGPLQARLPAVQGRTPIIPRRWLMAVLYVAIILLLLGAQHLIGSQPAPAVSPDAARSAQEPRPS